MSKSKIRIELACVRGKDRPGSIVAVDEREGLDLIAQGLGVKFVEPVLTAGADAPGSAESLLAAEKARTADLEKTVKSLEERIENGGKGPSAKPGKK
ncbi:hypothetical protein LF599_04620 [Pseudodesulfovibrio thermohalotolerans]|uniref:hypothetical protein n=1 Tax=Pseudodesulfovibrio thermohalotolerans TaxID=2880651 RepID=UPI00244202B5|nr:hypothetical protein [Pseudodesulfovibrio thermohalotolerans]WFS63452.1 hypothetical protein LF599_04620 [Pseudodesulfovibrio thermohalotolerans]